MKKRVIKCILSVFLSLLTAFSGIVGSIGLHAEGEGNGTRTDTYVMQYLEITVPEKYIQLTSSLSDSDEKWVMADINNPSERRDTYKNGNIAAAYFDPETHSTVYFMAKSDSTTLKAFDITQYSDSEMLAYAQSLADEFTNSENAKVLNPDGGIKSEVSTYRHPQMNMFTISFTNIGENKDSELIYGTIVNGMTIQFSMNTEYMGKVRPEIIEKVVSGVNMTTIMTIEEYEARVRKTWTRIGMFFGAGILLMVIFFIISKHNQKKKKQRMNLISERLFEFRKKKQAGEIDSTNLLYTVQTEYNKKLIEAYSTYNTWFRNLRRDLIMAIIYVALVGYAIYLGSTVVMILGIGGALILLYLRYSGNEKYQDNLIKRYDLKKKKSLMAEYRFYEDYFTLTGIDSISEYIYKQVYRIANYQGYMLIYISEENALVIDIEQVPEDKRIEFIKHILEKARLE